MSVEMCHPEICLFLSRACAARTYKSKTNIMIQFLFSISSLDSCLPLETFVLF